MRVLANQHDELKLRVVDIQSWDSPVARQHQIQRLPTLWLYEDGELVGKDPGTINARLSELQGR